MPVSGTPDAFPADVCSLTASPNGPESGGDSPAEQLSYEPAWSDRRRRRRPSDHFEPHELVAHSAASPS